MNFLRGRGWCNADDDLLVGIESGLFLLGGGGVSPEPAAMDFCVAYLQWQHKSAFGTSSGFMLPRSIREKFVSPEGSFLVRDTPYTLDDAVKELGYTDNARVGHSIGIVGLLSDGRLSREDYTFEAVRNALIGMFPEIKE